jgi:hypothetical protein
VIVGVTGHQNLGDENAVEWIRDALNRQITEHPISRGLSSLALGADQLFVEALRAAQIAYDAVIPCENYESTFADTVTRARYQRLLADAARIHTLPYSSPSEEAFFAAGKWIVLHCDLVIAVWNGKPARGLGGTADVVAFVGAEGKPWIHIDTTKLTIIDHKNSP